MAGAITHLLIAEEAVARAEAQVPALAAILQRARPFLLLGSVSPDLPYASIQGIWADRLHYRWSNLVPIHCAINLGCGVLQGGATFDAQVAWIAGYVAHCVTDATIHPIVQQIVGPYHADPQTHRHCEMTQDSLLYAELKQNSLRDSHFVDQLNCCEPKESVHGILDNWTNAIHVVFADREPWPDPDLWYSAYRLLLNAASDGDLLLSLSRVAKPLQGYLYYSADFILKNRRQEADLFYYNASLPSADTPTGAFRDHGYEYTLKNLLAVWADLWDDIQNARSIGTAIEKSKLKKSLHNWDLDTGADMDQPDGRVSFWPGSSGS